MKTNKMEAESSFKDHEGTVDEPNKDVGPGAIETVPTNSTTAAEKRLLRKIDFHVLPILVLLVGLVVFLVDDDEGEILEG